MLKLILIGLSLSHVRPEQRTDDGRAIADFLKRPERQPSGYG